MAILSKPKILSIARANNNVFDVHRYKHRDTALRDKLVKMAGDRNCPLYLKATFRTEIHYVINQKFMDEVLEMDKVTKRIKAPNCYTIYSDIEGWSVVKRNKRIAEKAALIIHKGHLRKTELGG